jgi:hypothetical protein
VNASAITKYWQQKEATSRYVIAQLVLSDSILGTMRRHLRRQYSGIKVTEADLRNRLLEEVLKREVTEGDRATAAQRLVSRATRKRRERPAAEPVAPAAPAHPPANM